MVLLVVTLGLSFTGYLLPWDQLAYWAITIGANIAQSPREVTDALGHHPDCRHRRLPEEPAARVQTGRAGGPDPLLRPARDAAAAGALRAVRGPLLADPQGRRLWRAPPTSIAGSGTTPRRAHPVFTEAPQKTYHLTAIVTREAAGGGPGPGEHRPVDGRTCSTPRLRRPDAHDSALRAAGTVCRRAPEGARQPGVPENPAKAPWYFLGLQELVSFSAFMGGVGLPTIVLIGLGLIPYLDRETEGTGVWFGGPGGGAARRLGRPSSAWSRPSAVEAFAIRFGWLREWFPDVPQLVITAINPGTVLATVYARLFAGRDAQVRLRALGRDGALHLFPVRLHRAHDRRHPFPRTELALLLVARRLARALNVMKKNKYLLLAASLGALAMLAWAAVEENFLKEWRRIQKAATVEAGPWRCTCVRSSCRSCAPWTAASPATSVWRRGRWACRGRPWQAPTRRSRTTRATTAARCAMPARGGRPTGPTRTATCITGPSR